jgi:hypothetical protein
VALRDYVYRPRKARIELAAYQAHINLPFYFGGYEWSIPVRSIAVVDLTVPGSPRATDQLEGEFNGRTLTYLFTTARARTATTLLLFAEPQRVPPLRLGPALDPNVRLPFGYLSSRRGPGAWVDGVLLRVDRPQEAADRLVAAGALRGIYRDGGWRVDRGEALLRPRREPPWARPSVDAFDGASRALVLSGLGLGWNLPNVPALLGKDIELLEWSRFVDDDIPLWAWGVVAVLLVLGVASRLVASLLYRRAPGPVTGSGRRRSPPRRDPAVPPGWEAGQGPPAAHRPYPQTPPRPPPRGPQGPSPGYAPGHPPGHAPPAAPASPPPPRGQPPPPGPAPGRSRSPVANGPGVGTVVGGRRRPTRPDPGGTDRGR